MIVGVLTETAPKERRVALVPDAVAALAKKGVNVVIEAGAGQQAGFLDGAYAHHGARVVSREEVLDTSHVILQVQPLSANPRKNKDDLKRLKPGQTVISFLDPLGTPANAKPFADARVAALSMELIPRITRAQSMDALSSQATIAGYKAVLLAADALPKMFPMMMTAAGTLAAAKVFVIGAGVAGLQAIATAKRLGAIVRGYDVRPAVKEQVESLGASFLEIPLDTATAEGSGGYAKEQSEDFLRRQREMMGKAVMESDVVITTASIPGKKAPVLVTEDMVKGMPPGSVVIDLAAERGGNCALTQADKTVVEHGVTIIGPVNIASTIPFHASQMLSKNFTTLLVHMVGTVKPQPVDLLKNPWFEANDEIIKDILIAFKGDVVHSAVRSLLGMQPLTLSPATQGA